jgi:hypothetical protein
MAQDLRTTVSRVASLDKLEILERNILAQGAATSEIDVAIQAKYAEFGKEIIAVKTGLDLSALSPAEHRIVQATGRLVALMKRDGKSASRTFQILSNRGFIEAAEVTVARSKVTQGFTILEQAELRELTFEQIIVDHADEFSARALWYARKTLGLPNDSTKPPADLGTLTQQRTESLFDWLVQRANANQGRLVGYTNAEAGAVLGFDDLSRHGRVLGNITSRSDYACYKEGAPPLGLCAIEPFANAWSREARPWKFPIHAMQIAAQTFNWTPAILEEIRRQARLLPGTAAIPWRKEMTERESDVRRWAESLKPSPAVVVPTKPDLASSHDLDTLERKLLGRKPAVRERVSKIIERGPTGTKLKKANGFRCQICDALGADAVGFAKTNGEPYVEAHHVTPVSELELGSLSATNIMILCANHHRQMHYGKVTIERTSTAFILTIDGERLSINRYGLPSD